MVHGGGLPLESYASLVQCTWICEKTRKTCWGSLQEVWTMVRTMVPARTGLEWSHAQAAQQVQLAIQTFALHGSRMVCSTTSFFTSSCFFKWVLHGGPHGHENHLGVCPYAVAWRNQLCNARMSEYVDVHVLSSLAIIFSFSTRAVAAPMYEWMEYSPWLLAGIIWTLIMFIAIFGMMWIGMIPWQLCCKGSSIWIVSE
jgi:hypothetical protein